LVVHDEDEEEDNAHSADACEAVELLGDGNVPAEVDMEVVDNSDHSAPEDMVALDHEVQVGSVIHSFHAEEDLLPQLACYPHVACQVA
jgi:hypothetical protein